MSDVAKLRMVAHMTLVKLSSSFSAVDGLFEALLGVVWYRREIVGRMSFDGCYVGDTLVSATWVRCARVLRTSERTRIQMRRDTQRWMSSAWPYFRLSKASRK